MTTIAILMGGKSAEHEISLISAMNILGALDRTRFEPLLIGVTRQGGWVLVDEATFTAQAHDPKTVRLPEDCPPLAVVPGEAAPHLLNLVTHEFLPEPAAAFAILHGPMGEDGTMQGLMRHLHIPFVGPDVTGSAVAMDKDVAKRLFNEAGIPNSPFLTYRAEDRAQIRYAFVSAHLQLPLFVKPAKLGSSVGISKVNGEDEFEAAIDLAFQFDRKILIEQGIKGREIECAVLGNENPRASIIGEIVPPDGFYDYESKYIDEDGAKLLLPAPNMDADLVERIQDLSIRAYQALELEGLSRCDFFLQDDGELVINEINTLPGFTKISMYPSLWGLSGIPYTELITQLIDLAISRKNAEDALRSSM